MPDIMKKYGHIVCSTLVFSCGIASLLPSRGRISIFHINGLVNARLAIFVAGFLALYISVQLLRRKRLAYFIALTSLIALTVLNDFRGHHPWRIALFIMTIIVLLECRKLFTVRSNNLNTRRAVLSSLFVFISALLYGAAGFYLINKQSFNRDFSIFESVKYSFLQLVTFEHSTIIPTSRSGHAFLLSLDLMSITTLVIVISNLFKPVKFALFGSEEDKQTARRILAAHSTSMEDFFKLFPEDKHYFFNKDKTAMLAYKVEAGVALILDGPSGPEKTLGPLLDTFRSFCTDNGWQCAVIHCDEITASLGKKHDFHAVFIGNEAIIDVLQFSTQTIRSKHFRYVENVAKRENLHVEFWQPPLTDSQLETLRKVSNQWLRTPGRREYTFIMGYFDDNYIRQSVIAVLKQDERTVAYTNIIPTFLNDQRSIDHMRHTADMPNIGMHYLLKSAIVLFHEQGVTAFNLGFSPLSGIDELNDPTIVERVLGSLKSLGSRYYSFSGLEQFKNKFKPNWQPRYMLYTGPPTNLLRISSSLNRATAVPKNRSLQRKIVTSLSLGSAVAYVSFYLAYPLGISGFTLASELGAKGEPYAWLFNSLDVLVGSVIIYLAYRSLQETARRREKALYSAYAVAGLFNAAAALTPLHSKIGLYHWVEDASRLHTLFSGLSILGFMAAITLFSIDARRWRNFYIFTSITLLVATIIPMISRDPNIGAITQKVQLSLIALFIFLIGRRD